MSKLLEGVRRKPSEVSGGGTPGPGSVGQTGLLLTVLQVRGGSSGSRIVE